MEYTENDQPQFTANDVPDIVRTYTSEDLGKITNGGRRRKYRRAPAQRVYCNRDVNLNHISYVGFDMDYTLAAYIRPAYDQLQYSLICKILVHEMGYPALILDWQYDSSFLIRGLLLDASRGNFVKCDAYGVVLRVLHGRGRLTRDEMDRAYPSGNITSSQIGEEFQSMDTLYHLPIANVYADLVDHFDNVWNGPDSMDEDAGDDDSKDGKCVHSNAGRVSYLNLWQDVRGAADIMHEQGLMKNETLGNFEKYP